MHISIVTLFPELYRPFMQTSLVRRAEEQGIISNDIASLFSFCAPKERVDAPAFGHGAGMVIKPDVVERAVTAIEQNKGKAYKVFFSPHGQDLDYYLLQKIAHQCRDGHLALFPARYEGMDARIEEEYADSIVSIGNFVTMGGDVPAMAFLEGLLRCVPGVVGKEESVLEDSFVGPFVDYPAYTAPVEWKGRSVPDVVRSGNHQALAEWRMKEAVKRTVHNHFPWLRQHALTDDQKREVRAVLPSQYAALMHTDVLLPDGRVGETSVTSIDIHDIARSSTTFGIERFFIVTPLKDQQRIVNDLIHFWREGAGVTYRSDRSRAMGSVALVSRFDEVIAHIEEKEGQAPIVVATSARSTEEVSLLHFDDYPNLYKEQRPILLLFGTASGLSKSVLARCDYVLSSIEGLTDFNHLSVRSAAAIIFDRLLGWYAKYK